MFGKIFGKDVLQMKDIGVESLESSLVYLKNTQLKYASVKNTSHAADEPDDVDIYNDKGLMELLYLGIPINREVYKEGVEKILDTSLNDVMKDGYSVRVMHVSPDKKLYYQSSEVSELGNKIQKCKVCWNPLIDKFTVLGHLLDAQQGGSYIMFVEKGGDTRVFNRFFVLEDSEGKKELFWDTIEGRNMLRFSVRSWEDDGVLHELALSIAGFVSIARDIGASRAYFSEFETEEFLKGLMEDVPKDYIRRHVGEKGGIQPYSRGPKPFFYRYVAGSSKYFIEIDQQR